MPECRGVLSVPERMKRQRYLKRDGCRRGAPAAFRPSLLKAEILAPSIFFATDGPVAGDEVAKPLTPDESEVVK